MSLKCQTTAHFLGPRDVLKDTKTKKTEVLILFRFVDLSGGQCVGNMVS